ncbi:neuralized-like protein 4 isoform X2 [Ptychodera flava]|uniref:neuralized-like protein 4 isoform X2 n=1 Tax=Ptychodera flava TaxID=63121 RepID=UPI00396A3FC6
MGNELSQLQAEVLQQQRGSTIQLLQALQAMIDDDNEVSVNDVQVEHAWDPDDCSDNFSVLPDKVTARRGEQKNRTDLIRGKKAYVSGTHVFEIFWPRDERGSHAMIGMATQNAPVSCVGYSHLLGLTSDSWGWSLVDKRLVHDGWECGIYPSDRIDYEVPDTFHVILNADDGTLRFKADGEDLGIAFTDLPHQDPSKSLCISASATCGNGDVRMRYMGTTGGISQFSPTGEQIVSVPAPAGSSYYTFHPRCGDNVDVMHGGRVARRREPRENFNDGVVLTRQPLKNNVRFQVRLDTKISRWSGSLEIGFTSNNPAALQFPGTMTECTEGVTLMWSGSNILKNGDKVSEIEVDLDDCTIGDTVGIERKDDGSVHFFFNGKTLDKALRLKTNPDVAYGVVDIYGQAGSVTISETGEGVDSASANGRVKSEISGTDPNAIMFAMRETVELLAKGSEVDILIAVQKVCKTIMAPFDRTSDERLRQRFGDHLASLGGGHELTKLLQRLQRMGDRNPSEQTWLGITVLRNICWNYSDSSLKLCKQFGQSGLLELMLKDIDRFGPTKVTNEKRRDLVRSALGVLHNCAKATENKQVYLDIRVIERIAPFMKSKDLTLAMIAMLTLSYVIDDHKIGLLAADEKMIAHTLGVLQTTLDDPRLKGTLEDSVFSALEITTGLGNIAVNDTNKDLIVKLGGVPLLVDLLKKDRPDVQESAANAIWTLAQAEGHRGNITSIPGAISTLTSLCRSTNTAVKEAAERALIRIKSSSRGQQVLGGRPTSASRGHCSYRELCGRFKKSLELQEVFFEPKFDMCYCTSCHNDRGDKLYYARGQPAKDYGVPFGWCRFALKTPPKASALDVFKKWHVAFHGTRLESVKPILETGEFLMPGDVRMGGAKLSECDGHFSDDNKPQGFDTKQIFLSPSIRYSGCDVYAPTTNFTDKSTKKSHQARVVFQVCINPTSYKVGPQTIGVESEIDPKFSNQEIEWFTKERGSVIPYGLLVKIE